MRMPIAFQLPSVGRAVEGCTHWGTVLWLGTSLEVLAWWLWLPGSPAFPTVLSVLGGPRPPCGAPRLYIWHPAPSWHIAGAPCIFLTEGTRPRNLKLQNLLYPLGAEILPKCSAFSREGSQNLPEVPAVALSCKKGCSWVLSWLLFL